MPTSNPTPDAIARISLFGSDRNGRRTAIPPNRFRCPVFFGEQRKEANDCMFLLDLIGVGLDPGGAEREVPIKFLSRESVAENIRPGVRFTLWEGRDIGVGEILEVVSNSTAKTEH